MVSMSLTGQLSCTNEKQGLYLREVDNPCLCVNLHHVYDHAFHAISFFQESVMDNCRVRQRWHDYGINGILALTFLL